MPENRTRIRPKPEKPDGPVHSPDPDSRRPDLPVHPPPPASRTGPVAPPETPETTTDPLPTLPALPEPAIAFVMGSYGQPSIDQHDAKFIAASDAVFRKKGVRVDPRFIKAVMGLESGEQGDYHVRRCRPFDGHPGPLSCGPMQIKWRYHKHRCPECNEETVAGHIELATHIIGDTMKEFGLDEYGAYTKAYLPTDDINGTTQQAAVQGLKRRVRDMERDAGTTPAPPPTIPVDPIATIVGGVPFTDDYGWLDVAQPKPVDYGNYAPGHGTSHRYQHPGIDVAVPLGTKLYAPAPGVVSCVGLRGSPQPGRSCGYYEDSTGGPGNITIKLDGPPTTWLTLGHSRSAAVKPGDRVTAGQLVGTSGDFSGPHVHVETSILDDKGRYLLVEPRAALAALMKPNPRAGLVEHRILDFIAFGGEGKSIWLPRDVEFKIQFTPVGPNRSGRELLIYNEARGTVWHETGNTRSNADAQMHANWQANGTPGHPDGRVAVHAYVDDKQIIQTLPFSERGIHAGDARNQTTIGVERCVNQGIDHAKAERNAAHLHATLLRDVLHTTVEAMERHTVSACPATINGEQRWPRIQTQVSALIASGAASPSPGPSSTPFPGLSIPVSVFESLWMNPKVQPQAGQPFTEFVIRNKHWFPISNLIRDGDDSYLVTGGGLLRYRAGTVEKL